MYRYVSSRYCSLSESFSYSKTLPPCGSSHSASDHSCARCVSGPALVWTAPARKPLGPTTHVRALVSLIPKPANHGPGIAIRHHQPLISSGEEESDWLVQILRANDAPSELLVDK